MAVLAGLAVVLGAAGIALFLRRDIGGVIRFREGPSDGIGRSRREPRMRQSWHLASVLARSLASLTATVATWGVALAVYAAAMTAIVQQAQQPLLELIDTIARQNPTYGVVIARMTGGSAAAVNARALTAILTVIAVVFSAFTVTLASRWAQDTDEGRLDLVLATPCPRSRLIAARFAAVLAGLVTAAGAIFTGVALTGVGAGLRARPTPARRGHIRDGADCDGRGGDRLSPGRLAALGSCHGHADRAAARVVRRHAARPALQMAACGHATVDLRAVRHAAGHGAAAGPRCGTPRRGGRRVDSGNYPLRDQGPRSLEAVAKTTLVASGLQGGSVNDRPSRPGRV